MDKDARAYWSNYLHELLIRVAKQQNSFVELEGLLHELDA
jgi:hypothetical protein